ncbi:hypothetical protein ACLOJK_035216 [Asimina triloba]
MSMLTEGPSNCNSKPAFPHKRARHNNNSSVIPAAVRSKGVNGHWGAQISVPHQRIWLGPFRSENAAAMAYDSAAIFLRSRGAHRNFPWTNIAMKEPNFQALYAPHVFHGPIYQGGVLCHELFHKELTPSDAGKLNRLVIPKRHAVAFFPCIHGLRRQENGVDETELVFYDRGLRPWKFRYCYWSSSRSYVFTRGWNLFVKEMQLNAKDIITFYACEYWEGFGNKKAFYVVDIAHSGQSVQNGLGAKEEKPKVVWRRALQIGKGGGRLEREPEVEEKKLRGIKAEDGAAEKKVVRLFGVQIN